MTTVIIERKPSYVCGPRQGFKNPGTVKAGELEVDNDVLIHGDLEVSGSVYGNVLYGTDVTNHVGGPLSVDVGSHISMDAGATNFDASLSTGTFLTSSGQNTLSGNVAIASGKNLIQAGAGSFSSGSGVNALNGNVTIAGAKTFTSGTGTVSLLGNVEVAADKNVLMQGSGVFTSGSGDVTLNGDVIIADGKDVTMGTTGTFTSGAGAVALNGHTTIASGKTFEQVGTGTFKTGTGAVSVRGDATVLTGKTLAVTDSDKLTVGGIIVPQIVTLVTEIDAASVSKWLYVAPAAYELVSANVVYTVASASGTVGITKSSSVQTPAQGTSMLNAVIATSSTANTINTGTLAASAADCQVASGNKIGLVIAGTGTGLVGGVVTINLKRI